MLENQAKFDYNRNMQQIYRQTYLEKLRSYLTAPMITVVSGPRRVGKSVLLRQLAEDLQETHEVIYIDKESFEFDAIATARDLMAYIDGHSRTERPRCIIIDEIQQIDQWERAAADLNGRDDTHVVISGSNASLLAGDLATQIAGRYINLPVFSLSLPEFIELHRLLHSEEALDDRVFFMRYLSLGGLPGILHTDLSTDVVRHMQKDIVNTIAIRDIVSRYRIRDIRLFEAIMSFALENIGSLISAKRVADFLKKERRTLSVDSVLNYLRYMQDAFLLYEVPRFDCKGKRLLEINHKYYLGDIGIRNGFIGYRDNDIADLLENLVFLELSRRGYSVTIGTLGGREIDFVAEKEGTLRYIQVAYLLESNATIERELAPFRELEDAYPRILMTMDTLQPRDLNGVRHLSILDFLLGTKL